MGKIEYKPRRIDDLLIVEGLCGIAQLDKEPSTRNTWFVVGGIATQSYLPSRCRRPTSDIDLALLTPLSYSDFKKYSKPVREYLGDKGFNVEEKKGHNAYMIIYTQEEQRGVIEFSRRNKKKISKVIKRLEDELENSRVKIVEGRNESYRVSSPEDIVSPKIVRGIRALKEYEELEAYLKNAYPITDDGIERDLRKIDEIREEARMLNDDLSLVTRLRFAADVYDIKVLSELTGFNIEYLKKSMSRWDSLQEDSPEKRKIISCLLPFLDF
ncbi:MAG: hypothetical protein QXX68_01600 [Candidatus Pacearchaeota archaeon]